jgi:O-antigen ligase
MDAALHKPGHLQAAIVGFVAAWSAVSLTVVGYEGAAANRFAFLCSGALALLVLSGLAYLHPRITVVIAVIFLTSPIPLVLSLPQSAAISAFVLSGATIGLTVRISLRSLTSDPLFLPIGIFATFGVISAAYGLWAGNPTAYVLGDCFQIIEFALVYFLVAQLLRDPASIRLALRCWLASAMTTILVELLLFALGPAAGNLLPSWEGDAASDALVRTIDINAAILFAVLFNLYPVARSKRQRFWIRLALFPTVASLALSLSRGLWLCSLVAVIASLLLQHAGRKRLLKAFAAVSICVLLLATAWKTGSDYNDSLLDVFGERIFHGVYQVEEGFAGTESLATRRFLEMAIVGPQVIEKPLLGHGLGATYVIGGFAVLDSGTNALIDHHFIHNLYLVTAFRMGVIGLGLLLWVLVRYFRRILASYRTMTVDWEKALVVGFVASMVGQLFLSLTQPTIIDHPTCAVIACAMALSVRLAAPARGTATHHDERA